jgi:hypothetical protein
MVLSQPCILPGDSLDDPNPSCQVCWNCVLVYFVGCCVSRRAFAANAVGSFSGWHWFRSMASGSLILFRSAQQASCMVFPPQDAAVLWTAAVVVSLLASRVSLVDVDAMVSYEEV